MTTDKRERERESNLDGEKMHAKFQTYNLIAKMEVRKHKYR
jgi:hypothetical protein